MSTERKFRGINNPSNRSSKFAPNRKVAEFHMVVNMKKSVKKNFFPREGAAMNAIDTYNTPAHSPHSDNNWETQNWKKINRYVKRLRQRIFRAEQTSQKRKLKKLQRLMLRSKANLLLR